MFLPHFFVSSCPVGTFLIDYTGTRYGNQYQYICVYIIDIRWAETIGNSILCQFVSPCPAMSHDVSRCLTMSHDYTCCLGLSHIYRIFNVPSVSKIPSRPSPRFSKRPAESRPPVRLIVLSVSPLRPPRHSTPAYSSIIVSRRSPDSCVRIVWIVPSRIYRLEYRLSC